MLLNAFRRLLTPNASLCVTPCRGTVVVERWYQVPLAKLGEEPYLHPRRHRIYRVLEDTKHKKKEKMELILTQTVAKLGSRGDTVLVEKAMGRNKLLPQGLAVYPSPENRLMFLEEKKKQELMAPEDRQQTWTGQMTVAFLKRSRLEVRVRQESGWTLSREIVARHFFRNLGVVVPVHALTIPEQPITACGEYWCDVTVNGVDTVRLVMDVVMFDRPRSTRYRRWWSRYGSQEEDGDTEPPAEGSDTPSA